MRATWRVRGQGGEEPWPRTQTSSTSGGARCNAAIASAFVPVSDVPEAPPTVEPP